MNKGITLSKYYWHTRDPYFMDIVAKRLDGFLITRSFNQTGGDYREMTGFFPEWAWAERDFSVYSAKDSVLAQKSSIIPVAQVQDLRVRFYNGKRDQYLSLMLCQDFDKFLDETLQYAGFYRTPKFLPSYNERLKKISAEKPVWLEDMLIIEREHIFPRQNSVSQSSSNKPRLKQRSIQ